MSDRCDSALAPLGELDPDLKTPRPTVRDMPTDWKRPRPRRRYASQAELQRQATAYHEASHLVVGVIMDLEPMRVTIEADGHALGRCQFHQMWAPSALRQWVTNGGLLAANARAFIDRDMLMSLAGMVGQRLFEPA